MTRVQSMGRVSIFVALGFLGSLSGCGAVDERAEADPMATNESPLYLYSPGLWDPKTPIPVCFTNLAESGLSTFYYPYVIRNAVEAAWTRTAGIYFSGWGACTTNKGIQITYDQSGYGDTAFLGQINGLSPMNLNLTADILEMVAVHEFGHAIGFAHEQNRADNTTCLPCQSDADCGGDSCKNGFCRSGWNGDKVLTSIDVDKSVLSLSYCNFDYLGPSPFDVVGSRLAYPDLKPLKIMDYYNLCLGVYGYDSHGPGSGVETYYCAPNSYDAKLDEQWSLRPTSNGYYRFVNTASGLCLGVTGVDSHISGAAVEVYGCNPDPNGPWGNDPKQDEEWKIQATSRLFPSDYLIINRRSGLYLSRSLSTIGPTNVYVTSTLDRGTTWKLYDPPVSFGKRSFKIANAVSRLCVGARGVDKQTSDYAELYDCAPKWNDAKQDEEWEMRPTSDGYFNLVNANSGNCLGVDGWDWHSNGTPAVIDPWCTDQDSEWIWAAGTNANAYTQQLVNRNSGLCLGVPYNDRHGSGTGLEVWDCPPVPGDPKNDENWIAY